MRSESDNYAALVNFLMYMPASFVEVVHKVLVYFVATNVKILNNIQCYPRTNIKNRLKISTNVYLKAYIDVIYNVELSRGLFAMVVLRVME